MADPYEEYQHQVFLHAEADAQSLDELEAHADPVFCALAEGKLDPLIHYLKEMGDVRSVPLSRGLANHLADMLQGVGKSLFRLKIAGRVTGERGRKKRLRVRDEARLIGYCADRLIQEGAGVKNAKWAKGEVGVQFDCGKTKVEQSLKLVRTYSTNARRQDSLNDRFSAEYEKRFGQLVRGLKQSDT